MKIGLNQGCIVLSSDLETDLLLAESAGFDYLELRTDRIRSYLQKHTLEDLRTFFDSHHLKPHAIGGTYVYREFLSSMDNPEQQEALLKDIRFAFEAGRAVGSDCIIVVPPMNPEVQGEIPYGYSFDDTLNLFLPMLQKLSDLAAEYGMKVGIELVGSVRCSVRTVAQGLQILQATGRSNIGLTLDAFNLYLYEKKSDFDAIASIPGDQIFIVHINDAPDVPPETLKQAHRTYCDAGVIDLDSFLLNLKKTGYDGMVSIEFFEQPGNTIPPDQVVEACYRTTRSAMARNGVV